MRETKMKLIEDVRPLFSLTVGEFVTLVRTAMEEHAGEEAKIVTLNSTTAADQELSIEGLMAFLGCSKASVHNYKKRGMPFYRVGRKVLFKKEEVLAFMKDIPSKKKARMIRMAA